MVWVWVWLVDELIVVAVDGADAFDVADADAVAADGDGTADTVDDIVWVFVEFGSDAELDPFWILPEKKNMRTFNM